MNDSIKLLAESIVESLNQNDFEGEYEVDSFIANNNEEYFDVIISWHAEPVGSKILILIDDANGYIIDDEYMEEQEFSFNLKELNELVNDML